MPVYVYECPKCKKTAEIMSAWTQDGVKCMDCKIKMKRIIAPTNFILKGSGWAKDGYSKESK